MTEVLAIIRFKNKALRDAIQKTRKTVRELAAQIGLDANRVSAWGVFPGKSIFL